MPTMALAMPPPGSPTGFGMLREEVEVERLNALADDEEQDERQRHERDEHGERAEPDEQRRHAFAERQCGIVMRPTPRRTTRRAGAGRSNAPCSR